MSLINQQVLLASRPVGLPKSTNFSLVQSELPEPDDNEILCKTLYLSLDPYMRGRMNEGKSYVESVEINDVMVGATVSEIMVSNHPEYKMGDIVLTEGGWQEYSISDGEGVRKIDFDDDISMSYALGIMGMPGLTAYVGLLDIGQPKKGDTVVVSAAAGAVGSIVGQIAKLKGCRVIGVAGSPAKCKHVVSKLGFDDCINYKSDGLAAHLANACPDGVDVYFESVGGRVLGAVIGLLNVGARMPVCGGISYYNLTELPPGPDKTALLMRSLLINRVKMQGFIVFDHYDREEAFLKDMTAWIKNGDIKYSEDVVKGLANTPEAFKGMLMGKNLGKQLIKVSDVQSPIIG